MDFLCLNDSVWKGLIAEEYKDSSWQTLGFEDMLERLIVDEGLINKYLNARK